MSPTPRSTCCEAGVGTVERLLWLQSERVLPSSDHEYDYSRLPLRMAMGDWTFHADVRAGATYSEDTVDPDGDTARVLSLLEDAACVFPIR